MNRVLSAAAPLWYRRWSPLALLLIVALVGCGSISAGSAPIASPPPLPTPISTPIATVDHAALIWPESEAACAQIGGTWGEYGIRSGPWCRDIPTADSGRLCTDSAQCEGACLYPIHVSEWGQRPLPEGPTSGTCSPARPLISCSVEVIDSRARGICAD